MLNCNLCKHDNPDGSKFCLNCGALLSSSEGPKEVSGTDVVTGASSSAAQPGQPAQVTPSPAVPPLLPLTPNTVNSHPTQTPAQPQAAPTQPQPTPAPTQVQPAPVPVPVPPVQNVAPPMQGQMAPVQQPQVPYVATQGPNSQYYGGPNSVPFNSVDQQAYAQRMANPRYDAYESVSIMAFVFGLVGFVLNPLYLISLAAIILGIIGQINNVSKRSLAIAGWILGIISLFCQLAFDLICAASTCGVGAIAIFF